MNENTILAYTPPITDAASLTYTLSGTDASLFEIDADTGVVTFIVAPDFENPQDDGQNNDYNITVTLSDGTVRPLVITVTDVNEEPVVSSPIDLSVNENDAFLVDLLQFASDEDAGNVLSLNNFQEISGDPGGIIFESDDISISLDPEYYNYLALGETEIVSFSYDVVDGNGGVTPTSATITITGTNDGPVLTGPIDVLTDENDGLVLDLLQNASDIDDTDELTISNLVLTSGPADLGGVSLVNGVVTIDSNYYDYLALGESIFISGNYDVLDGNGGVTPSSAAITITGSNDAPIVSSALNVNVDENETVVVEFLQFASDVDLSNVLSVTNFQEVSGDSGGLNFSPDGLSISLDSEYYDFLAVGESEIVTFTYDVIDNDGGVTSTSASIVIQGSNDAPVVSDVIDIVIDENDGLVVDLLQNASDIDDTDELSLQNLVLTSPAGTDFGGVSVSAGVVTVDSNYYDYLALGESIVLSGTYDVVDGNGGVIPTSASITITGSNDAPVVSSDINVVIDENDGLVIDLLQNASDIDGTDELNIQNLVLTSPAGTDFGGVSVVDGVVTVDPDHYNYLALGESVVLSGTYDVVDGHGGVTTSSASITITGSNDAPVISLEGGNSNTSFLTETNSSLTDSGTLTVTDVDITDQVLTGVNSVAINAASTGGANGIDIFVLEQMFTAPATFHVIDYTTTTGELTWFFDSGSETFDYLAEGETLILDYVVAAIDDSFTYDNSPPGIGTFTVTVTITGTNDAPVISVQGLDSNTSSLTETDSGLTHSGTLTVTDVDVTDVVIAAVDGVVVSGTGASSVPGGFDASSYLTVAPIAIIDGTSTTGSLAWNFDSEAEAFNFLATGETLELVYTVSATDDNGATTTETITVTITGTDEVQMINLSKDEVVDLNVISSQENIDLESLVALSEEISATVSGSGVSLLSEANASASGYSGFMDTPDNSNVELPSNFDVWGEAELASDLLFLNDVATSADSLG